MALTDDISNTPPASGKESVEPPFPDKMTFKEMLTNLFNVDFLTHDELQTISDAGEMYANGCLKQAAQSRSIKIQPVSHVGSNILLNNNDGDTAYPTPDSREEGKGEDDMAKDWVNNKIWDLTSLDEEEKNKFIQTICKMTGSELMKLFIAFKLKTHIECMCINDNDGQEFILSFRTLKDHLEHYKIPAESTPPAPVSDAVDDKFEFVEWVNESYTFIKSKIGIKAWVNFKENDVLVHGSDYHYITLINEVGKTLPALYTIFLTQKQKV